MKKKTLGIIMFAFFGGLLLTWSTAIGIAPPDVTRMAVNATGTLADVFEPNQRIQFCGTGQDAKSNRYITEYKIPTKCTQPHAIIADPSGTIWFAQDTAGRVASFEPETERFVEFNNTFWPPRAVTSVWGMDYSPDNSVWFTDPQTDSIWRFDIDAERYERIQLPLPAMSFPQQIKIDGSRVIINDLNGGNLIFFEAARETDQIEFFSVPSLKRGYLVGGFDTVGEDIWYTVWQVNQTSSLVRFSIDSYIEATRRADNQQLPIGRFIQQFDLPEELETPIGLKVAPDGKVWIADTLASNFFSFDPSIGVFTHYVTSPPHPSVYGNSTGMSLAPVSGPYWISFTDDGLMVFNEHLANRMAVMNVTSEEITEYHIPSTNYKWADCQEDDDECGAVQAFRFVPVDDKVWFTEWAANNIGVLDTSVRPEASVAASPDFVVLEAGQAEQINMTITPHESGAAASFVTMDTASFDITVRPETDSFVLDSEVTVPVTITASGSALSGIHKVLVGVQLADAVVSKYITVAILPSESGFIGPT